MAHDAKERQKCRRIARTLKPGESLVTREGIEVRFFGHGTHPGSVRVVVTLPGYVGQESQSALDFPQPGNQESRE